LNKTGPETLEGHDTRIMERYCSSYFDKDGLYNDGFPCPVDKYCCQTPQGVKMCCLIIGGVESGGGGGKGSNLIVGASNQFKKQAAASRKQSAIGSLQQQQLASSSSSSSSSSSPSHMLSTLSNNLKHINQVNYDLVKQNNNVYYQQTPSNSLNNKGDSFYMSQPKSALNTFLLNEPASSHVLYASSSLPILLSK
jgi:hypothetical protein